MFVSEKRQNGWTDPAQILYGTSRDPREGFYDQNFKKFGLKVFIFVQFWKCTKK